MTSSIPESGKGLNLESIDKAFGRQPVFQNLSAHFGQGEFVAITGPSGSGKTTLLNLIAGLDHADRGLIALNGQPLGRLDEQQHTLLRRRHMGIIFQFFNLIPTLTVWENCILPLQLNDLPIDTVRLQAQLAGIGLADKQDSFPEQLSGGEQQRVAIIRALVHQPSLVLADEPTGNLDRETARQVSQFLLEHWRQSNSTLIVVTHSEALAALAQRQLVVANRQLTERIAA